MKKIWVATEGAYSDYTVVAVFEREEDAIEAAMGDEVEEFPFFAAGEGPQKFTVYKAMGLEGDMEVTVVSENYLEGEWNVHVDNGGPPPKRPKVRRHQTYAAKGRWMVSAIAGDRDAAVKAVKDRLAAAKAEA